MSIIHCESIERCLRPPAELGIGSAEVTVGDVSTVTTAAGSGRVSFERDRFDKAVVKWRRNPIVDRRRSLRYRAIAVAHLR